RSDLELVVEGERHRRPRSQDHVAVLGCIGNGRTGSSTADRPDHGGAAAPDHATDDGTGSSATGSLGNLTSTNATTLELILEVGGTGADRLALTVDGDAARNHRERASAALGTGGCDFGDCKRDHRA